MANHMTFRVHTAAMWSIVLSVLMLVAEAIYLFVEGVLEFTLWFQLRTTPGKAWLLLDGIVTLILAAMIWRTWPSSAAWVIGTLAGIGMFSAVSPDSCSLLWYAGAPSDRRWPGRHVICERGTDG